MDKQTALKNINIIIHDIKYWIESSAFLSKQDKKNLLSHLAEIQFYVKQIQIDLEKSGGQ